MPYKDPNRKRQWEEEHREQRNARRRKNSADVRVVPAVSAQTRDIVTKPRTRSAEQTPDPRSGQNSKTPTMQVVEVGAWLLAAVVVIVALLAGAIPILPKSPGPSASV